MSKPESKPEAPKSIPVIRPSRNVRRFLDKRKRKFESKQKDDIPVPPRIREIIYRNCRGKNANEVMGIVKFLLRINREAINANRSLSTAIDWLIILRGNDYY